MSTLFLQRGDCASPTAVFCSSMFLAALQDDHFCSLVFVRFPCSSPRRLQRAYANLRRSRRSRFQNLSEAYAHTHSPRLSIYICVCVSVCVSVCLCVCVSVCLCGHHIGETHSEAPLTHTAHFRLFGAVICHVPSSPHVSMFFAPIRRSGPCGGHLQEAAGGLPGVSAGAHGGCAHGGSSQQLVG